MKPTVIMLGLLSAVLMIAGCGDADQSEETEAGGNGAPTVYTTNFPLTYFAQRIAGDTAEVRFPEIDGDPAFWEPGDEDVAAMQGADLILTNGATYEKWAAAVSLPSAKTVDTSAGFADQYIRITDAKTHSHGDTGEHSHAGTAFTTWMDITQARQQAEAVRDALIEAMPDQKKTLNANADKLLADLDKLHANMQQVTQAIGDRPLVASHPVYQYFARRYGLDIEAVLWEPETVPTEADMEGLEKLLKEHNAKWMIWEGEPAEESVQKLQSLGVASVVVDPAGNRPDEGDWLSVMQQNVENLKAIADADRS